MKNAILAAMFLFLICDGYPQGPNQPTHFEVSLDGGSTWSRESAYPCPSPLPQGYTCAPGDVLVHHDLTGYPDGVHSMQWRAVISVPGAQERTSTIVPFVYGPGSFAGPTGWGMVSE